MNKQDLDEFIEHAELNFLPNALLWGDGWAGRAIEIAKAFRKTFEQEPVAWMTNSEQNTTAEYMFCHVQTPMHDIPLYTAPPKREWQGLTDEEREYLWGITPIEDEDRFAFVLAVEAKLKEKNT